MQDSRDPSGSGVLLRLQHGLSFQAEDDGSVRSYFRDGRGFRLRWIDRERTERAFRLLADGMEQDDAAAQLAFRCGVTEQQAARLLTTLRSHGALIQVPTHERVDVDLELYDRQVKFLEDFEAEGRTPLELCHRLQDRKIVVVGLGALGSWILFQCARAGIRRIVGIDFDRVELSNLHRTILYRREDVGFPKAERWTRLLRGVDHRVEFESHVLRIRSPEDLVPLLDDVDLVFNQFGYLPPALDPDGTGEVIPRAGLIAGVPVLSQTGSWTGPLTVPGETACLRCVKRQPLVTKSASASVSYASAQGRPGGFAPRIALWAGVSVWEASRFLSGLDRPPSLDGVIALDTFSYRRHAFIEVPRDPHCEWCGDGR
jgi:hypothetical protein